MNLNNVMDSHEMIGDYPDIFNFNFNSPLLLFNNGKVDTLKMVASPTKVDVLNMVIELQRRTIF